MLQAEFINYLTNFDVIKYTGIEDFSDKFNFLYTVGVFILCTFIISMKQYSDNSIACYIPVDPSGKNFKDYLENYCWVHGTVPLFPDDRMPHNLEEWNALESERKLNYYQWVPFVLGLQCIMFYIPRVLWQMLCNNETGTDLENLIKNARNAVQDKNRDEIVKSVAEDFEDMLFQHRDFRRGRMADMRRKVYKRFSFCVISKRLGNWIFIMYFFIKMLYMVNSIGQLILMKTFLGFNGSMTHFGYELTKNMIEGRDWQQTLYFPRVTFCNAAGIRHIGTMNNYIAQCALPINMVSEKIYIFLWFWTLIGAVFTAISIPTWMFRVGIIRNRLRFVKKYLRISNEFSSSREDSLIKKFINNFLRHDGIFILRMLSTNAGDLVTSQIIQQLWNIFKDKYSDRDLRNDPRVSICMSEGRNSIAKSLPGYNDDLDEERREDFV